MALTTTPSELTATALTITTAAQPNITSVGTLSAVTVDNLGINGNTITANSGALNLTPASGSAIVLDGTINVDAGVVTGATSITSTAFVGGLTGNVTGNASGTALTVTQAAQSAITSVGTLTGLQVDGGVTVNGAHINIDSGMSFQWGDSHERIEQSDGKIEFFTNNGEQMTLSGSYLGIGIVGPTRALTVYNASEPYIAMQNSSTGTANSDGAQLQMAGTDFYLTNYEAGNLIAHINGAERMRIHSDGKVDIKNSGTDKVARFINTGSGTQGITVGTTTADNAGKGLHLAHDNSSTAYVHAYNYAGAAYDNLELRGNTVSAVGGTGHNVFRACANGLFSIGSATYTQGRIRQFVYTASVSNGTTVDLFYNTGAYDDLHLIATIEATHSSRTYRYRAGPFGYYQSLPQVNAGVGLDFTSATVNTGRRMLQFTNSSGYTAATYISILIIGDNGVTVSNGAISDLL